LKVAADPVELFSLLRQVGESGGKPVLVEAGRAVSAAQRSGVQGRLLGEFAEFLRLGNFARQGKPEAFSLGGEQQGKAGQLLTQSIMEIRAELPAFRVDGVEKVGLQPTQFGDVAPDKGCASLQRMIERDGKVRMPGLSSRLAGEGELGVSTGKRRGNRRPASGEHVAEDPSDELFGAK